MDNQNVQNRSDCGRRDDNTAKIEYMMRSVCFNIKKKGREILQDFDITPPQFDALQFLIDEGELTIGELSARLYLAPSTITDLIDRMEKSNLVQRVRDTKDRRTVKIQVMENGYQLICQVIDRRCQYIESKLINMPEDDKVKFLEYLNILNSPLE